MTITLKNKDSISIFAIVLGLIMLGSMFDLTKLDQARLDWIRTWTAHDTGIIGWLYSISLFVAAFTIAYFLYKLWWKSQFSNLYNMVVVDNFQQATYKLVPKEVYDASSAYIPEELKKAVLEKWGSRCFYTGRKLHADPITPWSKWIYKKTKDSKNVFLTVIGLVVRSHRNLLSFDHVIPRRLGGETSVDNIVPASFAVNSLKNQFLKGRFLVFAVRWCYDRGLTIHKDALR